MYLNRENFEQVLKSSLDKPLFCLFFDQDPSCDPAKTALTSAISDNNEFVTLALCDIQDPTMQMFAAQIGLRAVPTLVVIDQGQPAAILEGQDIVSSLQETLNKFMPSASALLMREALESEASGDMPTALAKASEAFADDKDNLSYRFIYARMLIAVKNTKAAHELLDNLGREEKQSPDYLQLMSALDLAEQAQNSPELLELQAKFEQDPSDENAVAYAVALADAGKKEDALDLLFAKLKESLAKEDVKKTFLDILSTMDGDPNQSAYRRKLYTIMY